MTASIGARRRVIGLLLAGWLLGLLTAFMWPALTIEKETVVVTESGPNSTRRVASQVNAGVGWVVSRVDQMGSTPVVQLERPRYAAVSEQLHLWWWDFSASWGATAPRPTPTPPRPTEAPKPAAPAPKAP